MTRFIMLFIAIGLILVGCSADKTNGSNEKNTPVVPGDSSEDHAINIEITPNTEGNVLQDSPEYVAKNEREISIQDAETAYEMCVRVLTDYYKAVWNGTDIELGVFIDNENLKRYTQKKIQYQFDLHSRHNLTDNVVKSVNIGTQGVDWEVEYTDDADGGFLYLKLPAEIKMAEGSRGEVTEFLVRNVNGKLVIVDWYDGGKDSYDFIVRGENLTIDNPNRWNDSEWVKKLNSKQVEFSGSVR
ncbi:hypothetical protein T458_08695 [Brevibacillus panacihumi W25]|uniref:Lipoprotein n=1 Tax=Brevibacillus panacihumi W25 TaxID=1408254 RepID=V6MB86_9BACL|nr:hypothetical protein [Brevibacillus panacihumi]EST55051.1 hypothetical protein T458_08980 [Brevibacillus panacihumi W25]EST55125.1 hypothetical protein T458_08695 [Brevibacillus panacihumi W25]